MNIYDIDTKLGCWIDGSHWSALDLNKMLSKTAEHYGYKPNPPIFYDDEEEYVEGWSLEADDALDYLNSICPHGYWFEIEDNSLFLRSEDD